MTSILDMYTSPSGLATISDRHVHLPVRSGNNIRQTCTPPRPFWHQYQTDMYASPSVLTTISDRHVHLTVSSDNNIRQTCTPPRLFWKQYQTDMYASQSGLALLTRPTGACLGRNPPRFVTIRLPKPSTPASFCVCSDLLSNSLTPSKSRYGGSQDTVRLDWGGECGWLGW